MQLDYRVPDAQRLEWAKRIVEGYGDRLPETQLEVYAREQLILHERQYTEIVVQAIRIGDIGITTTPNETYALTGLKFKLQSPLTKTMVIELANGGDGYIPPPEQHHLGGYNTWPARSSGPGGASRTEDRGSWTIAFGTGIRQRPPHLSAESRFGRRGISSI